MANCEGCGTTIHCTKGCYMLCTTDCLDCSGGCEPRTVLSPLSRQSLHAEDPLQTQVRFCAHDLEPDSMRQILGSLLGLKLEHAPGDDAAARRRALQFEGTLHELLATAGLRQIGGGDRSAA